MMRWLSLKCFLLLAVSVAVHLKAVAGQADSYPVKPVRWIVAVAPGGFNDVLARVVSSKLTQSMGQQIIVDNRPGAGGLLGASMASDAAPDGYTLLLANAGPSVNVPLLRKNAPYKVEDFTPIVYLGYTPLIIVANPSIPVKNPKELVGYLKDNSGKINWASSGVGSPLHIGLALFQAATSSNVTHVVYKGAAQALTETAGGAIQFMHATKVSAGAYLKSGRVRVIGVASKKRSPALPDVPTLAESGIQNAEAIAWFGMAAPLKTPRAVINRINAEANKILSMPDVRQRLDELGVETVGGTPEEFAQMIRSEAARLASLIKAGILHRE